MINLGRFWERKPQVEKINIEIPDSFLSDVLKEVQKKFGFKLPLIIDTSFLKQYIIEKLREQNVKVESLEDLRNWLLNQEESFWTNLLEFHNRRILILGLGGLSLASLFFYLGKRFVPLLEKIGKKEETEESLFKEIIANLKSFISNIEETLNLELSNPYFKEDSSTGWIYFPPDSLKIGSLEKNGAIELEGIFVPKDEIRRIFNQSSPIKPPVIQNIKFNVYYTKLEIPENVNVEFMPIEDLELQLNVKVGGRIYIINDPSFLKFVIKSIRLKKGDEEIVIEIPIPSSNQDLIKFDEKSRTLFIPLLVADHPESPGYIRYGKFLLEVFALKLSEEKSGILFLITKLWYLIRERERSEKIRKV